MNPKKAFFVMVGVVVLMSIGLAFTLVKSKSSLTSRSNILLELKLENRVLDEQQSLLVNAISDVAKYSDLEKIANTIVPQDKDQAKAIREIVNIAGRTGIKLSAISFPASTLGQAAVAVSTGDGTAIKPSKSALTQVKPVENITGVYEMEINIEQDTSRPVSYNSFIKFLEELEKNRRTAQVSTINVQPNPLNRSLLSFSLTVKIYIKP